MSKEFNFQKYLRQTIFNADPDKIDRNDLLEDIFKSYVAKLFEFNLNRSVENRLEFDVLVEVKRNLISEFRNTELAEYQKSVEFYEELFDKTIQEIFNDAAKNHQGVDSIDIQQTLEINPNTYVNEGGLYVPEHMKNN